MKTITLALIAAFIGSATLSAPSFAKSRHQGAPTEDAQLVPNSESAFDPFHQTGFNGNH
jgi:hypothetical protein